MSKKKERVIIESFDQLINAFEEEVEVIDPDSNEVVGKTTENHVRDFMDSGEFQKIKRILLNGYRRNTCMGCLAKTYKVYPKQLKYLEKHSPFSFHYSPLCENCATKLGQMIADSL